MILFILHPHFVEWIYESKKQRRVRSDSEVDGIGAATVSLGIRMIPSSGTS
jgi:hypothetical protein